MPMAIRKFFLLNILTVLIFGAACSKDSGQSEQKQYIPEPSASSAATENQAGSPADSSANGNTAANTENDNPAEKQADTVSSNSAADANAVPAETAAQNTSNNAAQASASNSLAANADKQQDNANNAQSAASAQETASAAMAQQAAAQPASQTSENASSQPAENENKQTENNPAEKLEEQKKEYEQPSEPQAQPKAVFGPCDRLYEFLKVCSPFKCSIASNFLGQQIDDVYEVKGIRNGKCRYVTGIHMENKSRVTESTNMICNLPEKEQAEAALYLIDTKNLKNSDITGVKDSSENDLNPFLKYSANNLCVKACKKNQNETKQIVLENGHFVEKNVRCPSED